MTWKDDVLKTYCALRYLAVVAGLVVLVTVAGAMGLIVEGETKP